MQHLTGSAVSGNASDVTPDGSVIVGGVADLHGVSKPFRWTVAGGLVTLHGKPLRSTLGGAGIAVSALTQDKEAAVDYARFTASAEVQKGLYFEAGGQPGHRSAWTDLTINRACNDFFQDTLTTLDEAILRPRYPGYMAFQDEASPVAHAAVAGRLSLSTAVKQINDLYLDSLR